MRLTGLKIIRISGIFPQLPSKHPDRKQALKEAEVKLDARLVEQERYFANPEIKRNGKRTPR